MMRCIGRRAGSAGRSSGLALKTGPYWQVFIELRGEKDARQSVEWRQAMIAALDSDDFCPSVFRARKPE